MAELLNLRKRCRLYPTGLSHCDRETTSHGPRCAIGRSITQPEMYDGRSVAEHGWFSFSTKRRDIAGLLDRHPLQNQLRNAQY